MLPAADVSGSAIPYYIPPSRGRVHDAFWQLLAYRHDGLAEETEIARLHCVQAIDWHLSISPRPVKYASKEIVLQIQAARDEFAEDLRRHREWLDYKAGRRSIPYPVVGPCRDWRGRRRQRPVWPFLCYEMQWSFWQLLAYEHDGLTEQAAEARLALDRSADQLRRTLERYARNGNDPETAIAEEIDYGRKLFADDLWREENLTWFDWRDFRGRRWVR